MIGYRSRMRFLAVLFFLLITSVIRAFPGVVINEIQYNPVSDLTDDEYLELFNTSYDSIDLGGWTFREGIRFTFPSGTAIPPRGFLVVVPNQDRFRQTYGDIPSPIVGNFTKNLSNSGEKVALADALGVVQAEVAYSDKWPWNPDADGSGRSLECIDPDSPIADYRNWLPSRIDSATGTPGYANSVYQSGVPPFIASVRHEPLVPAPGESVRIEAGIELDGLVSAFLYYDAGSGYQAVPLFDDGLHEDSAAGDGTFTASIPGHEAGTLVRYYIEAAGTGGVVRFFPTEAPAYGRGWRVSDPSDTSPLVRDELILEPRQLQLFYNFPYDPERQTYGSCLLDGVLYETVRIRLRGRASRDFSKKNWRIDFPKSHLWDGVRRRINFNSDYHDASHMRTVLSYKVFQRLGIPTAETQHVRLFFNGHYFGLFYRLEHMDEEWLSRMGKNPDREMYECYSDLSLLDSMEQYWANYNKKSGSGNFDYSSLIAFIEGLNAQRSSESRSFLETTVQMDSFLTYMAGRALLSNKDDYRKNLFLYQNDSGKWELFPHDWDLTWGHAWDPEEDLLNRNFTVTMQSLDVLSNRLMMVLQYEPTLRAEFFQKLKSAIADIFREDIWFPVIDELYQSIRQAVYEDGEKWETNEDFDAQPQQLKDYIALRRQYLLEVEIPAELGTPVANWPLY